MQSDLAYVTGRQVEAKATSLPSRNKSENEGLISEDRSSEATLLLTIPRSSSESSARDLARPTAKLNAGGTSRGSSPQDGARCVRLAGGPGEAALSAFSCHRPRYASLRSGVDSDLEAFSHNPADGSFAPLADQPSANTKCLNQRFLSY